MAIILDECTSLVGAPVMGRFAPTESTGTGGGICFTLLLGTRAVLASAGPLSCLTL